MSFTQIEDRLNRAFQGSGRQLIFWYDDNGAFAGDVDSLRLTNAKVYRLQKKNQFYTKYFLERVDKETNYLLYADFPKPRPADNHLEDMLLYSKQFYADRISLFCNALGIPDQYKPLLEPFGKLLAQKDFEERFAALQIERYDRQSLLTGLLCAVCQTDTCSFTEALRAVLTEGISDDNRLMQRIEREGLRETFWDLCSWRLGYSDAKPSLERLTLTLFVTCAAKTLPLPEAWKALRSEKSGSAIAFLHGMMNSVPDQAAFDALAEEAERLLHVRPALEALPAEELLDCEVFAAADALLIRWIAERLLAEDDGARLDGLFIPQICEKRCKLHFGARCRTQYRLLESAYDILNGNRLPIPVELREIAQMYKDEGYRMDQAYRKFCLCFDRLEDAEEFEPLRTRMEAIYTENYLSRLLLRWNAALVQFGSVTDLPLQREFYRKYVKSAEQRTVVILSDALRYEVGQELFCQLRDEPKCAKVKLDFLLGVLPSYTRLGMAALLPHRTLELTEDFRVLADGLPCDDLASRQAVLQGHCPKSFCIQFDDLKAMTTTEIKKKFAGMQAIYVYQNQIDARGDEPRTEDEVFAACEEAIEEILRMIRKLTSANTTRFLVTADHGFLYQRGGRAESGKLDGIPAESGFRGRRWLVSEEAVSRQGVSALPLGLLLGNHEDTRTVSFPTGNAVFKMQGGGQNYVHSGSSPQELLIPVLEIRTEKGRVETRSAQIKLVSTVNKVTNLHVAWDFLQAEPIGDVVKAAVYRIAFVTEQNERVSNEITHTADSRESEAQNRIFRLRFTFKNQKYERGRDYFLSARDENGVEVLRHPVKIDLAFTDDFGF